MRSFIIIFLTAIFFTQACATNSKPVQTNTSQHKIHDLVLIHGLANKHKWSDSFLEACLETWGSGRVFVVYTSPETSVTIKTMNEKKLIFAGGDGKNAGTASINEQVLNLKSIIQLLQRDHKLQAPFSIIAHSMGGLVSRKYIYKNPGKVAGLVTLGTPHHGSPLANSFQWMGYFLSASDAIEDLKPEYVEKFNKIYPVMNSPLASNKKIYTIRGVPEGTDCFGWMGELFIGWQILSTVYGTESDGLVPHDSAVINGAAHIADFPGYDHYDLVLQPDVAVKAAEYLP